MSCAAEPDYVTRVGRESWATIHTFAAGVRTDADVRGFLDFLDVLTRVYPCSMCRKNFAGGVARVYLDQARTRPFTPDMAVRWTSVFHALVTISVSGTQNKWATPAVRELYKHLESKLKI